MGILRKIREIKKRGKITSSSEMCYWQFGHNRVYYEQISSIDDWSNLKERSKFIGAFHGYANGFSYGNRWYRFKSCIFYTQSYLENMYMYIYYKEKKHFEKLIELVSYDKDPTKNKIGISLLEQRNSSINARPHYLDRDEDFDIEKYNFDASKLREGVGKLLGESGLIILHGEPGTGKTSFIKNLADTYKDQNFLYIPPNLSNIISDPGFIGSMGNLKNSVLIIEDGENILMKRSGGDNQAVSNILNMSNGILGDIFNITIIVTFNKSLRYIDPALLRSGRLKVKQEFGKINGGKTVAEITNESSIGSEINKKVLGFK